MHAFKNFESWMLGLSYPFTAIPHVMRGLFYTNWLCLTMSNEVLSFEKARDSLYFGLDKIGRMWKL